MIIHRPIRINLIKQNEPPELPESQQPQFNNIRDVVDANMVPMQDAFMEAIAETQGAITYKAVSEQLAAGNYAAAAEIIDWDLFNAVFLVGFTEIVKNALEESGKLGIKLVPGSLDEAAKLGIPMDGVEMLGIGFDLQNPKVIGWLENYSAQQITVISEETRKAIMETLVRAEIDGVGVDEMARRIRPMIGLNRRQAIAVDNLRKRLEKDLADGKITREQLEKRMAKYISDSLDYRAEMIARYELMNAAHAGKWMALEQQHEKGLINLNEMVKTWRALHDGKTCPTCLGLDRSEVLANDMFPGGYSMPPIHPHCRCDVEYKPKPKNWQPKG